MIAKAGRYPDLEEIAASAMGREFLAQIQGSVGDEAVWRALSPDESETVAYGLVGGSRYGILTRASLVEPRATGSRRWTFLQPLAEQQLSAAQFSLEGAGSGHANAAAQGVITIGDLVHHFDAARVTEWEGLLLSLNRQRIAAALRRVTSAVTGRGCNTLVIDVGEAYLQFRWEAGERSVIWEAVSNTFLPAERRLQPGAIEMLRARGFEDPEGTVYADQARTPETAREVRLGGPATSPNFFRYVDIVAGATPRLLAGQTLALLGSVYARSPLEFVQLTETLGDGCRTSGRANVAPRVPEWMRIAERIARGGQSIPLPPSTRRPLR